MRLTKDAVPFGHHILQSFAQLPEFGSVAKTDIERKLLDMFRAFQYPRCRGGEGEGD